MFNPITRLRIVRRGARGWIAMHWDKRDDDLMPFDDLPKTVVLTNRAGGVRLRLGPNVWVAEPPAVRRAHFWREGTGPTRRAAIAFSVPKVPRERELDNVRRVRMAALEPDARDPARLGRVLPLFNAEAQGRFTRTDAGFYEHRWTPTPREQATLQRCCSAAAMTYGTSIWFEDLVGHVGLPEVVQWQPPR